MVEQEAANRGGGVVQEADVVGGKAAEAGELEGCPEGVLFARDLGHGKRSRRIYSLPPLVLVIFMLLGIAIALNILFCGIYIFVPGMVQPSYCSVISKQVMLVPFQLMPAGASRCVIGKRRTRAKPAFDRLKWFFSPFLRNFQIFDL
jgi:hypothetical protein